MAVRETAIHIEGAKGSQAAPCPVRVYTSESDLLRPEGLLREMFRDLWASRELAWRLFVRDTRARYRQSVLGYVWAFLPPVAIALAFVTLNTSGILTAGESSLPYPAFVIIGTLLWQLFVDAVNSSLKSVSAAKAMLSKINFPREAILLAGVLEVLFNFLIRAGLLVPVFLYYKIAPPATAPLALVGVAAILCLGLMIGMALTPVGMLYTDVSQALSLALSFWMLLTPVAYAPPSTGALAFLTKLNPVSPLIIATREWLAVGVSTHFWASFVVLLASLLLLFGGWVLYRLSMPILVERMGN